MVATCRSRLCSMTVDQAMPSSLAFLCRAGTPCCSTASLLDHHQVYRGWRTPWASCFRRSPSSFFGMPKCCPFQDFARMIPGHRSHGAILHNAGICKFHCWLISTWGPLSSTRSSCCWSFLSLAPYCCECGWLKKSHSHFYVCSLFS